MPTLDQLVDLAVGGFTGPLAGTASSDPRLDAIVDQAVARHRPRRDMSQLGAGLAAAGAAPGLGGSKTTAETPGILATAVSLVPSTVKENLVNLAELPGQAARAFLSPAATTAAFGPQGPQPGVGGLIRHLTTRQPGAYNPEPVQPPLFQGANLPGIAQDVADEVHAENARKRDALAAAGVEHPVAATAADWAANTAAGVLDPLVVGPLAVGHVRALGSAAEAVGGASRGLGRDVLFGRAPGTTAARAGSLEATPAAPTFDAYLEAKGVDPADFPHLDQRSQDIWTRRFLMDSAHGEPEPWSAGGALSDRIRHNLGIYADPEAGSVDARLLRFRSRAQQAADAARADRYRRLFDGTALEEHLADGQSEATANAIEDMLDYVADPETEAELARTAREIYGGRGLRAAFPENPEEGSVRNPFARVAERWARQQEAGQVHEIPPAPLPEGAARRLGELGDRTAGEARVLDRTAAWERERRSFLAAQAEGGLNHPPPPEPPAPPGGLTAGQLDPLTYDIRHNYVTSRDVYRRRAGMRFREIEEAVPDVATRQDMTALLQRTGNPLIPGDTPEAVQARIWASPHRDQAVTMVNDWRAKTDELFAKLKDIGFADDMGYHRNYIRQIFEDPEEAITHSVDPKLPMSPTRGLQKSRTFGSYEEAIQAGMKPRSLDFATLAGLTEKNYGETMGLHQLMRDVADLPGMEDGLPAILKANAAPGPNYVKVNNSPILERAVQEVAAAPQTYGDKPGLFHFGPRQQQLLPGTGKLGFEAPTEGDSLYLHKDLWKNLEPVLRTADSTTLEKGLQAIKRVNFLYSLFHGGALTGSSMKFFGPTRGIAEAAKRGFGVPGVSQILDKAGVGQVAEPLVEDAMRAGVKMGAPTIDAGTDALDALLQKAAEGAQGMPVLGNGATRALEAARGVNRFADKALWEITHDRLKAAAYHFKMDQVTRFRAGDAGALGLEGRMMTPGRRQALLDMPLEDAQRSVAKMVNDTFGGQNWELHKSKLLNDKNLLRVGRAIFQSPDWNMSALRSSSAVASSDPLRRTLGVGYLKNAAKIYVGMNLVNYLLSGHLMTENQPGRKFHLDNGELGPDHRFYGNPVIKHSTEAIHLATDPIAFLGRKIASPWQGIVAALSGHTLSGFPSHLQQAEDQAHEEGRDLALPENIMRRGQDLFGAAMPFNLSQLTSPREAWKLAVPMTEAKGLNTYDAFPMLAAAYRSGDDETIARVNGWLEDNGYDPKRIHSLNVRARDIDAMTQKRQDKRDQREEDGYLP